MLLRWLLLIGGPGRQLVTVGLGMLLRWLLLIGGPGRQLVTGL
jgi:hypothetical protein